MIGNFAVHLAFSTLPSENESDFIKAKRGNFTEYREGIARYMGLDENQNPERLYNPLVYHLFGTFDVVFVSLIDNYKFCQKVFDLDAEFSSATSFQIVTGICDLDYLPPNINDYFPCDNDNVEKLAKNRFVHITNFKVNNGLLVGNGNKLINAILKKLSQELEGSEYILFKSFSWSEIVLIQFSNNLGAMQNNIIKFREYNLGSIADDNLCESICNDSLYDYIDKNNLFINEKDYKIKNCHVFVDTHSYSGVDYYEFNQNYGDGPTPYDMDNFISSIELQAKPGHFKALYGILEEEGLFETSKLKFKNGKTDFLVKEGEHKKFLSNYKVNRLYRHKLLMKQHVRKIKTNFLVDVSAENQPDIFSFQYENNIGVNNFRSTLADYYTISIKDLKQKVKKIGVSRQIREKILKAFSNYNNLIKDIILYSEFIELRFYLEYIKDTIEEECKRIDSFFMEPFEQRSNAGSNLPSLISLEKKWTQALDIFEDAYRNRVNNNYLYEDLNEFSIDFNSAINQINSVQDFLVKTVNNAFFPLYKDQIIVTQNEIDSKSNVVNVNYNVYHYLEPCLIFTTLMKEIINGVLHKEIGDSENQRKFDENYFKELKNNVINNIKPQLNEKQLFMIKDFDFFYFFSDLAKMAYTFAFDYDLYEFWAWAYFLQDSSLYNATGFPEKGYFRRELIRMSLIKCTFNYDAELVDNPVPETFDVWQKSIQDIYALSCIIVHDDDFKKAKQEFLHSILSIDSTVSIPHPAMHKEKHVSENDTSIDDVIQYSEKISIVLHENGQKNGGKELVRIKLKSDFIQQKIKNKENIYTRDFTDRNLDPFYFVCAISNATLYLLKEDIVNLKLLKRCNLNGHPVKKYLEREKTMFIDPCGGFFYNDYSLYEKHFFYRNYVIDTLWSLAEIDKKRLFFPLNKTK